MNNLIIGIVIGLIIGSIIGIFLMCLLQINRDNKAQRRIYKAIELVRDKTKVFPLEEGGGLALCDYDVRDLLEILGGDVDE